MITLTIDGKQTHANQGDTIMQAAKSVGVQIPSLCYLEGVHKQGACRICVVEVAGAKTLQPSCMVEVREGMEVKTSTKRVRNARKLLYEMMLSDHDADCLSCQRNQNCELQALGQRLGVREARFNGARSPHSFERSVSITRDMGKCILCRRCVSVCEKVQEAGVLNPQYRGFQTVVGGPQDAPISSLNCSYCGQCTVVCPVGALRETDTVQQVWDAIHNPELRVVVQVAPAVRVAIGELFGLPVGKSSTGKLATALHDVGFDDVFDTNFGADITILEEGTELLGRLKAAVTGGEATLPMITSCSPGWIKYVEHTFPDSLGHLSSCKSPHTMLGALIKSYYAEKLGVPPQKLYVVSVMPCTAKKFEIERPEMCNDDCKNVDAVLTTRECAQLFNEAGISYADLPDGSFDNPMGLSSGAADIFGLTGGVMEAALRTVYELVTGRPLPFNNLHVTPVVGLQQVKQAKLVFKDVKAEYAYLEGVEVQIGVTSGLAGAKKLMKQVEAGESPFHFIEVMGCPSGCIAGGGQPRTSDPDFRTKRLQGLYSEDEGKQLRKSHENKDALKLYEEYLGEPCGHRSHTLLHTTFTPRGAFGDE